MSGGSQDRGDSANSTGGSQSGSQQGNDTGWGK